MSSSIRSRVRPNPAGGFAHDLKDAILTGAGATADHFLRTWLSTRLLVGNVPTIPRVISKEYRDGWNFYGNPEFIGQPEKFFIPPAKAKARVIPAPAMRLRIPDAIIEDVCFDSDFKPVNPAFTAEELFPAPQHQTIARHIRHKKGDRPTIIVIHGYVLDGYQFNASLFDIEKFFRLGMNVLMYTLPYHGPRAAENSRFSGDGFFHFDIVRLCENMAWSVHGLTRYITYLKENSDQPVGLMGVSLGGYHTALMATLDKRIAFAIPVVPVTSLLDLILDWQPSAAVIQFCIKMLDLDEAELRRLLAVHSPLSRPPVIDKKRIFIIAGSGDRMAHPDHAQKLWEHWGQPNIYWFPGNHLLHFEKAKYMREILQTLRGLKIF